MGHDEVVGARAGVLYAARARVTPYRGCDEELGTELWMENGGSLRIETKYPLHS